MEVKHFGIFLDTISSINCPIYRWYCLIFVMINYLFRVEMKLMFWDSVSQYQKTSLDRLLKKIRYLIYPNKSFLIFNYALYNHNIVNITVFLLVTDTLGRVVVAANGHSLLELLSVHFCLFLALRAHCTAFNSVVALIRSTQWVGDRPWGLVPSTRPCRTSFSIFSGDVQY